MIITLIPIVAGDAACVQGAAASEFYDAVASLGSSVSSFVSTTAASIRSGTQSFASAASALGGPTPSAARQLPGDFSRHGARLK